MVLKTKKTSHIALEEGSSTSTKKDGYFSEYTGGWLGIYNSTNVDPHSS